MTDRQTPEEQEPGRGRNERRQVCQRIVLSVLGVVLLLIVMAFVAAYACDRYWLGKVAAKDADLRARGRLVTYQDILDRDKSLPPGKNLALIYLKAFGQLGDMESVHVVQSLAGQDPTGAQPSEPLLDMLRSEAENHAKGLQTILNAPPLADGCYPLKPAPIPWALLLPHCEKARLATILCGHAALLHTATGQPDEVAPCLLAGFGLASSFGRKPLLVEELVRFAADAITLQAVEHSLSLCELAPRDLQALRVRMERERGDLSLDAAMVFERTAGHFTFEEMIGKGDLKAAVESTSLWYRFLPGWRQKDELSYDSVMDSVERAMALPPRQALRARDDSIPSIETLSPPPVLSAMLLPPGHHVLKSMICSKVQLSVACAALAVEQYRLKNGHWPDSLDRLVPGYLDAVPEDPFGTGKVRYKHTDTGVMLYSIGPDDKDQGGITEAEARPKIEQAEKEWQESQPPLDIDAFLKNGMQPEPVPPGSTPDHNAYDLPFRLLDPELRGAKTATFREEVLGSGVSLDDLKEASLDEDALRHAGLTDDDLKKLRGDQ